MPVSIVIADPDRKILLTFPERATELWSYIDSPDEVEPKLPEGRTSMLHMPEEAARALYEALAERFGGTGHDTRALRRDYDDERKRVDKLTDALVGIAARSS
ncbi:hypothetical protein [Phycicoccus sp.]|mgnify:CR=1 FL=1|uniref:hypothetical protein n=1 Tax=Phycicoccus sp. TaxID=1902410 RepID=UPI002BB3D9A8|nr:hypothetical protein [Phycicoccus sp.]HMM95287.1 hypothetical protein [Phycicoccus sp.]